MAGGRGGHPLVAVGMQALPDRRRGQPSATGTRARAARNGPLPKQIARAPGRRPAQVTPLVRLVAAEDRVGATEPKLVAAG
jgi:hypothetical protein